MSDSNRKKVTNTFEEVRRDPILGMVHSLNIEGQESRGQQEVVNSCQLPAYLSHREQWESLGFRFGNLDPNDSLFLEAEMPPGWSKGPTDHSMWNNILDDQNRIRGTFFYKAAFYDRKAHMRGPTHRYQIKQKFYDQNDPRSETDETYQVLDTAVPVGNDPVVLHTITESVSVPSNREERLAKYDLGDQVREKAVKWLKEKYPDCNDPLAYWD